MYENYYNEISYSEKLVYAIEKEYYLKKLPSQLHKGPESRIMGSCGFKGCDNGGEGQGRQGENYNDGGQDFVMGMRVLSYG